MLLFCKLIDFIREICDRPPKILYVGTQRCELADVVVSLANLRKKLLNNL
jgi:hypothetical protein